MSQPEPLETLYALPCELPAIEEAVASCIRLIEAAVPLSPEREEVLSVLRSFQQRYQEPLRVLEVTQMPLSQPNNLIPLQATHNEMIAFAMAVLAYLQLLERTGALSTERNESLRHLLTFQKRYIDCLPSTLPLND